MSTLTTTTPPTKSALPPIHLSLEEAARARFCFMGEFGYELVSWIPYLLHLKKTFGLKLRTCGRTGSAIFYAFSDDHVELDHTLPGDCWGDPLTYARIAADFTAEMLVHPGPEAINRRQISVGGIDWRNKNIHGRIDQANYAPLNFGFVAPWSPLPDRPMVVINNKYYLQWPNLFDKPVNYFDRDSLIKLRDLLLGLGYSVVYNHYVEQTETDVHEPLDDAGIFGVLPHTLDLRETYARCDGAGERNRTQLALLNAAAFVVGPQGGNLYLPAICRKPLFVLMRLGHSLDYTELARIYGGSLDMFYEPEHLLCWLEQKLVPASAFGKPTHEGAD